MDLTWLIHFLIWTIIIGSIFGLVWWLIDYIELPPPFNKVAKVGVALVAVILLINVLLSFGGVSPVFKLPK
jgi:hypothetical protein